MPLKSDCEHESQLRTGRLTKTKMTTIKSTIRKIKTKNTSSRRGICLSFSSLLQLRLTPRFFLLFSSTSPFTPCHNHTSISILPHGRSPDDILEPWEYWIAKIRDIRAEIYYEGDEEHNTVSICLMSWSSERPLTVVPFWWGWFFRCTSKCNGSIRGKTWETW